MKQMIKKGLSALSAALLALCMLTPVHAAETASLADALDQTARLQQLAEEYSAAQQTESDPMMLTVNYIRTQRYADATWDMILGMPSEEFAQFVEQQAPELEQLQTLENVQIPATGETVDFVHLVAGAGATYKRVPVVCTWGGDCIQLAGSIQRTSADEEGCIQQLKPYFACEDENASLMPQSDWLADLDGVNIGSTLSSGSDLSEAIEQYYENITGEERARRFVLAQFGEADTGDQQAFRQQVKDKFFGDSGVQLLLLSQKQMTLDEERNIVTVDSMDAPLNAVCSLTADTLAGRRRAENRLPGPRHSPLLRFLGKARWPGPCRSTPGCPGRWVVWSFFACWCLPCCPAKAAEPGISRIFRSVLIFCSNSVGIVKPRSQEPELR